MLSHIKKKKKKKLNMTITELVLVFFMFNFHSGLQWNNIAQISIIKQKNEALQSLLTKTLCFNGSFVSPSAYLKGDKKGGLRGRSQHLVGRRGGHLPQERVLVPFVMSLKKLWTKILCIHDGLFSFLGFSLTGKRHILIHIFNYIYMHIHIHTWDN